MTTQISRRAFLVTSGATAATFTVAAAVTTAIPARSAAAAEPAAEPAAAENRPLSELRVQFGTPTDLARARPEQAWTRTADGTVMTYDTQTTSWKPEPRPWVEVLGFGEVVLARWGHPSGGDRLVMVFGTATPPPPPTEPPTTPPPSGGSSSGEPTPTPTTTATTSTSSTAGVTPSTTASTTTGHAAPTRTGAAPKDPLAYTGVPLTALAAAGLAAIGAGAALNLRRRRMAANDSGDTPPPAPNGPGRHH